ncbi:MAG: right-handed parallel beta-helix repeat-containing protein [Saprospiraceae bacterium]|nr:right-handed parallel beta-helix repeat-containing protein [Saprospiraceae bacterium]
MKQHIFFPVLLALCLAAVSNSLQAATRYVKPTAGGTGDGSSWANASADLQAMVNASAAGDTVWVAAGNYKPAEDPSGNANPADPRDKSFYLKNGVKVFGGFAGTENTLGERNIGANPTILSGDFNGDDAVSGSGGSLSFSNNGENAYHVVVSVSDDNTTLLDGFTITGGNANGEGGFTAEGQYYQRYIGAGLVAFGASLSIRNCTFTGNNADGAPGGGLGGALYFYLGSPQLDNCTILNNNAHTGGGFYGNNCTAAIKNCVFYGNKAVFGSAADIDNYGSAAFTHCTFAGNHTSLIAVLYSDNYASLSLVNSIIWNNWIGGGYGAMVTGFNASMAASYSVIQNQCCLSGPGVIFGQDPLFKNANNPAGPDGIHRTADDGLWIPYNSPAINAGDPAITDPPLDITGYARTGVFDAGAYENSCPSEQGQVFYVKPAASGTGDGSSWANAAGDLQSAIDNLPIYCGQTEIWVAEGTYKPMRDQNGNQNPADPRTKTFTLRAGIILYGGFAGTENNPDERDIPGNPTILSGDFNDNDLITGSGASLSISGNNENAYQIAVCQADRLDGFTISGGNGGEGGGLNLAGNKIYNCTFYANSASQGGAITISGGAPVIANCIFRHNQAIIGSGIYVPSFVYLEMFNCTFSGNKADDGTLANILLNGISRIDNCIFWGNSSEIFNDPGNWPANISHSIVQGGYPGTGNLDADPLFVSPTNLRLQLCSPAVNAGINASVPGDLTVDMDGNPRIFNSGTVDMGAYELQAIPQDGVPVPPTTTDNALHFDGVNDHVALINNCGMGAPIVNGDDAITIEYWFRGSVLQSAVRLQPDGDHYIVSGHYGEHILSNDGGWAQGSGVPVGAAATDGKWHHIAMTWQRATVNGFKSYLDGELVGQRNSSANPLPIINTGAYLGALYGNDQLMAGSLDNVRIWNVARTKEQIQAGLCGLTLPQSGLVAWYAFDHGEANGNNINVLPGVENIAQPGFYNGQLINLELNGTSSNWIAGPEKNASRLYVDASLEGAGNLDGLSWETAFSDLQDALKYPCTSSNLEIWVAAGTYKPTSGSDRAVSFQMKNGVAIYGGFNGTETELSQRNWVTNVTILSGDLNGDDTGEGPVGIANIGENSFHVVRNNAADHSAVLDGFTIKGGNASSFDLSDNDFGGGMINSAASPTLTNIIFQGNRAVDGGGGMFNGSGSSPVLNNVVFDRNFSQGGGGGMYSYTGANPVLTNVLFSNNYCNGQSGGGGMFNYQNSLSLTNCTFVNNSAAPAGGMLNIGVTGTVTSSVFSNNASFSSGGAFYNEDTEIDFTNCLFSGNISNIYGGVMFNRSSTINVASCTFFDNTTQETPAVYRSTSVMYIDGNNPVTTIKNSIFWNNGGLFGSATPTITYSVVQGGWAGPGSDNASANPAFTNPDNPVGPDGIWGTSDDGLQLQTCSPALNAGDNTGAPATDLTGSSRIVDGAVDPGAYENQTGFLTRTWYLDADGDGYYTGNGITQCLSPGAGYVYTGLIDGGDCNDADGNIHPGAAELCNLTDDDCDGLTDEDEVCAGNIIYVNLNATGANDGSSWANAYTDLQSAISDPRPGLYQIWVAQGTYKPTTDNDRSKSFSLRSNWGIYGGFNGTETALAQRDWKLNETVLSGDIGVQGDKSDNSYHVVYTYADPMTTNNLANAVLDGFTITGGNANGGSGNGGGIFMGTSTMYPQVNPQIRNCTIIDNSASNIGGGICTQNSVYASIENCIFQANTASSGGAFRSGSNVTLINCLFSGNTATYGGGIHNDNQVTVKNCSFSGNSGNFGGAISQGGGSFTLTNCILWGNNTEIYLWFGPAPVVSYSIVQGGYAGTGNLNANPLFVNQPPIGLGTSGDLHLTAGSPAIDAGTATGAPATDLDGNPRPFGAGYEMGAYEFTGPSCPTITFTATPTSTCAGSNDGQIVISGETGGAGPYMYSNDNGMNYQIGATFTGLAADTYPVKIKDSNNCESATQNIAVETTPNATPTVSIAASPADAICAGAPVQFTASVGNTGGGTVTYHFKVNGGNVQNGAFNTYSTTTLANGDQVTCEITISGGSCLTVNTAGSNTITMTVNTCAKVISGALIWEHDDASGVGNATVALTGDETGSMTTTADGLFSFTIEPGSNLTITPAKTINKLNGVTTADATRIQQHIANSNPLTDLYKIVAADVNKSNSITTLDATIINQALLGNPSALSQFKTSWRFVPTSHTMSNPPWGFPENIVLNNVQNDTPEQNFFGIKTGDVLTPFANPANFNNPESSGFALNAPDRVLQFGEQVAVTFSANQFSDLAALQFALKFNVEKLALVKIEPLTGLPVSEENFGTYNISEGELRVVWSQAEGVLVEEGAAIFTLTFNVLESGGTLNEALQLADEVLEGHAYTSTLVDNNVKLNFFGTTSANDPATQPQIELLQNRPNPFNGTTTLGFVLPESCEAQLRIFDVSGRMLAEKKAQYPAGRNEETFDLEGASGVLWYELATPFGILTRKMVAVK